MSTIVQMPVRVKPPPAAERRPDDRVVEVGALEIDLALANRDLLAERVDAREVGIDLGLGAVAIGGGGEAVLEQVVGPPERQPGFLEADFVLLDLPARPFHLRFGQRQRGLVGRVVEPRQHLSFAHGHAFLDVHLDDLARDLRRHRRPPARRHITRGVEHGRLRPGSAHADGRDADLNRTLARKPVPARRGEAAEEQHDDDRPDPAARTRDFRLTVDTQGGQIVFQFGHNGLDWGERDGRLECRLSGLEPTSQACQYIHVEHDGPPAVTDRRNR
jgi:hypothetical protein